jgi:cellobiose-specific phosphotransferase system component IIA
MEHSTHISVVGEAFRAHLQSTSGDGQSSFVFDSQNLYIIAHAVRTKLLQEAAKVDQDLRRLICHANLLESLYTALRNISSELVESYEYGAVGEGWHEGEQGQFEHEDDSDSSSDDFDDSSS